VNGAVKQINFDIISSDPSQDSKAAIRGFKVLRSQPFFLEIEKPNYIVWADCGKHFRCKEFVSYLLLELASEKINGKNL
jgi:hypothetical protein